MQYDNDDDLNKSFENAVVTYQNRIFTLGQEVAALEASRSVGIGRLPGGAAAIGGKVDRCKLEAEVLGRMVTYARNGIFWCESLPWDPMWHGPVPSLFGRAAAAGRLRYAAPASAADGSYTPERSPA